MRFPCVFSIISHRVHVPRPVLDPVIGHGIRVREAPAPTDLLWENQDVPYWSRALRQALMPLSRRKRSFNGLRHLQGQYHNTEFRCNIYVYMDNLVELIFTHVYICVYISKDNVKQLL